MLKLSEKVKGSVIDYSNETEELTIKSLVDKGFTAYEASAYLNKLMIKKLSENDNDCKNVDYNSELRMPMDRMKKFKDKRGDQ